MAALISNWGTVDVKRLNKPCMLNVCHDSIVVVVIIVMPTILFYINLLELRWFSPKENCIYASYLTNNYFTRVVL